MRHSFVHIRREQSLLLYGVCVSFLGGVFLRSLVDVSLVYGLFLLLMSGMIICLGVMLDRRIVLIACICASFALGMIRFHTVDYDYGLERIDAVLDSDIVIEGVVTREPVHKGDKQRFIVRIARVESESLKEIGKTIKIIVTSESYPYLRYGDEVRLQGKIERPLNFENEITGRAFNYVRYLLKEGVAYQMVYPEVEIVSRGNGSVVKRKLFEVRRVFVSAIAQSVPEPHSALIAGVTVGEEGSLGEDIEDKFRTTGIIHIVVLSGYNVSLVSEFLMKTLAWTPLFVRSVAGIGGIVLFALFTGATATIVRASLMASCVIIARLVGREYDVTRALVFAGVVMVFENPFILVYDPSFQLSFLATLALIVVVPLFERLFGWIPKRFGVRDLVVTTLATQVLVLPLILYMTGEISLIFLPVNMLVLPFIPFLMFLGGVIGSVGLVLEGITYPFAVIAYVVSRYIFGIVDIFGGLSFAKAKVPYVSFSILIISYIFLIFLLKVSYVRGNRMRG